MSWVFKSALSTAGAVAVALTSACAHQGASTAAPKAAPAASAVAPPAAAQASAPPKQLPKREDLPLVLRETLHATMNRHGEELTFLLADVVLLQYAEAEELATLLANEPKLGRPVAGDTDSINALLPEAFFVHQSQLSERAGLLAKAAKERNDAALVKAFGLLAETCVGCHSSYLHDPLHALPDHDEAEAEQL